MGNVIYSNSFVDVANGNITARSEDSGYPKINIMERKRLKRRFRAEDVTKNDYLIKLYFGGAQTVAAVFLNDVNFDKVKIQGHATDSWGAPSYAGSEITISANPITGRYQAYLPLTGFNYAYMRIFIPSAASAVGDYTADWEIGTVAILSSVTELTDNIRTPYTRTGVQMFKTINLAGGGLDGIKTGDSIRWEGQIVFGERAIGNEVEPFTMNQTDMAEPLLFYENIGDTSCAYLCKRDTAYQGSIMKGDETVSGNVIKLQEHV